MAGGSDLVSRPPPLVSPQVLSYSRASDFYSRSAGSGVCSSQGAGVSSTPPYNYHCHSGSQSVFPASGSPTQHQQHLGQACEDGGSGGSTGGAGSSSAATAGGGSSPHTPLSQPHAHSHHSPLQGGQSNGFGASAASSMFSQAASHYGRANSWYMSPSADLNPGPADFSSSPFAMFDSQRLLGPGQGQSSASCQLAAFRAPYKASSYAYDCTKF
jgi:hypothetical protein